MCMCVFAVLVLCGWCVGGFSVFHCLVCRPTALICGPTQTEPFSRFSMNNSHPHDPRAGMPCYEAGVMCVTPPTASQFDQGPSYRESSKTKIYLLIEHAFVYHELISSTSKLKMRDFPPLHSWFLAPFPTKTKLFHLPPLCHKRI